MAVENTLAERVELCFGLHQTAELHAWREACVLWGFESPGARGWLLALVREAYFDPLLHVAYRGGSWVVWLADGTMADKSPGRTSLWPTETEALVAAREAAS